MKKILLNILKRRGLYIRKSTNYEEVLGLIKKLRPIKIDIPLLRLGAATDGGYLLPDDLEDIQACYSPGVGKMSLFEKACIDLGMELFLADYSVDKPGYDDQRLHFLKKFIGSRNDDTFVTMDRWVNDTLPSSSGDLLLQMDIEGYEYESLINMSQDLLDRFRIIVIEFHGLNDLWNKQVFGFFKATFDKLLHNHHCVHIHPNNCCEVENMKGIEIPQVAEFTFIRKDRGKVVGGYARLPHPLDRDNTPKKPINLSEIWYT